MIEFADDHTAAAPAEGADSALTEAERAAKQELEAAAAAIEPEPALRRKSKRGGKRRGAGRPRKSGTPRPAAAEAPSEPAPLPEPTEIEIAGTAGLISAVWKMLGPRLNRRPLQAEEAREIATAAIPVMNKYGASFLDEWGAELTLGMVLLGTWERTALPPAPSDDPAEPAAA